MRVRSTVLAVAMAASVGAQEGPRFLENDGHIALFEHDGSNYDKLTGAGEPNALPRQKILREFIETHGDFYDFVVIFTNFDFERGAAKGFYLGVRNEVRGIGGNLFDNGASFGSLRRLQGVIDMGPVSQYRKEGFSVEPSSPAFRATLGILAHEVGHRWLARARFLDGADVSSDLLGDDDNHWSYLLSSDASFLYGSRWELQGSGLYRATEVLERFSPLDLYLMGFAEPEEVPPFVLLRSPDVDPKALPGLGAVVSATEQIVTLDQVLAVEGERDPESSSAPKDFRLGFVFLSEQDLVPSPLDLEAVNRIRESFVTTFFSLTKGRGLVDTDLLNVIPPDPTATPDTTLALSWLIGKQKEDGRFEDDPRTSLRDTTIAIETLDLLGVAGEPLVQAGAWLSAQAPGSVDGLSRALAAGSPHGHEPLLSSQNADGGFGVAGGYRSDPLDSALALLALARRDAPAEARARAAEYLVASQSAEGAWSSIAGTAPDLLALCAATRALQESGEGANAVSAALAWLVSRQQADGGFGDGPSTPYGTACGVEALLAGAAPAAAIDAALDYLSKTQRPDGSWEGSVHSTAAVLHALVPASSANLALRTSDITLEPAVPEVGETVAVEVTVRNRSRTAAPGFVLELFDGDPELGGVAIGSAAISALGPGAMAAATFDWSTAGLEGDHVLFAVADMTGAVPELNKNDNVATRAVEILPLLPNFAVESLASSPSSPPEGVVASVTVRLSNRGSVGAPASSLRLYETHPSLGVVVGDVPLPALASGESFEATLPWETAGKLGRKRLVAVADPANDHRERFETDNELSLDIEVRTPPPPEPDLVVEKKDLSLLPSRLSTLPQDVTLTALVRNTGANPVPGTLVEVYQGKPGAGGILLESLMIDVPGDGGAAAVFTIPVATGGSRSYFAVADGANAVLERNETNNVAGIDLVDPMDTIDVALVGSSLSISSPTPTAGDTVLAGIDVSNRGTRRLTAVAVSLFASGTLAATKSVDLAPGATSRVELAWKANRLGTVSLEVRADPDDRLSELDETNNAAAANVDVVGSGLPNLTVASAEIGIAPPSPAEGGTASLSARVRNVGEVDASGFGVSFYGGDPDKNGILLGTVAVPALAAGADALVAVEWGKVNLRGTTLLFVVVDAGSTVEEFDETDNRTFKVVDIQGLPNLAATTAALRLEPPFARSGEAVTLEATFANRGEQEALDVVAEVRLDAPKTGALLASETFALLLPGEIVSFSALWDTTGVEGEHTLFLVLDALDVVREQREDDNVVAVPAALQDADLFVTPLYFSPDANGVQDEAAFFYRVSTGPVLVRVESESGVVRALSTDGPASGSVVWDGRNDKGSLARDGEYSFILEVDGAELARRRVVLDTNRSSVAEALGTDFVGFANLTCPLAGGFDLSGPAFLPDDSAAYFLTSDSGEPEYPAGLYRASADGSVLGPVATGAEYADLFFLERSFPFQAQRIVSPDGTKALAMSFGSGLQVLDLATGVFDSIGRSDGDARWSPDGKRILVADRDGIYLHSANGELLAQVSSLGAELVEWSPDGSRIVYRPWEEMILHVMNADGSNDRVLPATDAATLIFDPDGPLDAQSLTVEKLFWSEDGEAVIFRWFHFDTEESAGPLELDLDSEALTVLPLFEEVSAHRDWAVERFDETTIQRFRGRERRLVVPSSAGRELHWSYRDTYISYDASPEPGCVGRNRYLVRSLLNGEARFRLTALPSGFGVRITGTVADRNLDHYRVEYAPLASPSSLTPIQAPSDVPIVDDVITTWIPPGPGDYVVRLTLRDRAGNEVVRLDRVAWARTLPIASLRRSPAAISPNGDAVQDETTVEYNVLDVVNLVFRVRDEAGAVVKTIVRDEGTLGPVSFAWDGTDDSGSRVPDGRYRIEVSGAELPVLVDATPPASGAAFSGLFTAHRRLAVDLEGHIADANLEEWSLVPPDGEPLLSSIRPVGSETAPELLVEAGRAIQGLELRARDVAGNVTVVPLVGPNREVRVVSRHLRSEDIPIGPFTPGPSELVPAATVAPKDTFGWEAKTSFPATDLRFLYHEEGTDEVTEIPTRGRIALPARSFPLGRRFVGRFEADGLVSQELSFALGPDALFVEYQPPGAGPSFVSLVNTIPEELVEGTLFTTVLGEKRVFRTYRPVPPTATLGPPRSPCGTAVALHMEAVGASGKVYRSTTSAAYPEPAAARIVIPGCLGVLDAGVSSQSSPEAEVPATATASLFENLEGAPEALELLLADGTDVREVARVVPDRSLLTASFDVGTLAEGSYVLSARAELPLGATKDGEYTLTFFLDQTPPATSILSPVEGANACVVKEDDAEWVALEVSGQDRSLRRMGVELETAPGQWEALPTKGEPTFAGLVPSFQRSVLARIPAGLEGQQRLRLVVASYRIASESGGAAFPFPPLVPNNGAILGTAVRNLTIVRQQTLEAIVAEPGLFSPNSDGVFDGMRVHGDLREAASLTVRVYRVKAPPALVRTVIDGASFGAGPFDVAWDGLDDLGGLVDDGEYRVEVVAVNGCGATSKRDVLVEVDNTEPTVAIASPGELQTLAIAVEVQGTASDDNFDLYQLEFGEGASPIAFEPIGGPVAAALVGKLLGVWKVGELPAGLYTLRLTAGDRAGNASSTSVVVDVVEPELVASFGAEPSVFSPNGDGVRDVSELSFRLKRDSVVTLRILRPDDSIAATLLDGESRSAGDHTLSWDGVLPDGDYILRLEAEDALLSAVRDESRLSVVVDTTPPEIEVSSPSPNGIIALPAAILGRIDDVTLERFDIDVGPEDGALARLGEGRAPAAGELAPLVGLPDGGYRLTIHASDRAGNVSDFEIRFGVDSTAPVVELRAPAAGTHLSTSAGEVAISGRLVEENLDSYALEVGAGEFPSVFVALASGGSLPSADVGASWDVSVLPDGAYTLRLRAADRAGNSAEARRVVVLDGTLPEVGIGSPEEGSFAERDSAVLGTARDENFSEAVLAIARETAPLQELVRVGAPVVDGVLKEGLPFADGDYRLALTAMDLAGNEITVSRSFHIDSQPPEGPQGLDARVENRTNVRLAWQASAASDLAGYLVYRDGALLTPEPVVDTHYLDPSRPEGRYRYTVVAVDRGGLASEASSPVEVVVDLTPPIAVLRSPGEGERIRGLVDVVGTAFAEADFKEYRLSAAPEATPLSPTLLKRSPLPASFQTLLQWEVVALEGAFLLTLEAEDTAGNVAADTLRVIVDNEAPPAPVLTSVVPAALPEDVEITWEPSPAADVAGYLVFRNGRIANAPGVVSGDLRPFLVPGPAHVDFDLPDGRFCYRVAAMDEAGNTSFDSNEICIVLDNREPRAVLVEPGNGARFDGPRTLRATVVDEDVATVLFQFQELGAASWTDVVADAEPPFEGLWDVTGLPFGGYRLRAVATDAGSRTDPDPAFIDVTLGDSTPPDAPADLTASVDGDAVSLVWSAVSDPGLAGYRLYREDVLVETLGLETAAIDAGRPDGLYRYEVSAFDTDDNESARSGSTTARVYRPLLLPPFPVFESDTTEIPGEDATPGATVQLFLSGSSTVLAEAAAQGDGEFTLSSVVLPAGESLLRARATDDAGNRSRLSDETLLVSNVAPEAPRDLTGIVNGDTVDLIWSPNAEGDLSGYVVRRGGESLIPEGSIHPAGEVPTALTPRVSSISFRAGNLIDGNLQTTWSSAFTSSFTLAWVELEMAAPRHVSEVRLFWGFRGARNFRVLAELSGRMVPLATVRENTSSENALVFPFAVRTSKVRVEVTALALPGGGSVDIREVELYGSAPLAATTASDTPDTSGVFVYGVSAIDVYGGESAPSEVELIVGDVVPPEAPFGLVASVALADVTLDWSPSPSPDVATYRIYRDGSAVAVVPTPETSYVDSSVADGDYRYEVAAVDFDDNESVRSNEALASVSVDAPEPPVLDVTPAPEGRALDLVWTASTGPVGVAEYAVSRAAVSGGPYVEIARTPDVALRDAGLENGVPYFYVARAIDPRGEASPESNEASGAPEDSTPPDPPVLSTPTTSGAPITVQARPTTVAGSAEPGALVKLFRGLDLAGEVEAASSLAETKSFPVASGSGSSTMALDRARRRLAEVGRSEIRLTDLGSGSARSVAFDAGGGFANGVAFSPEGGRLAVAMNPGFGPGSLRLVDLETGAAESFPLAGEANWPAWVDEDHVAVGENNAIFRVAISTGLREEIYRGPLFFFRPQFLRVSPERSRLAFIDGENLVSLDLRTLSFSIVSARIPFSFDWTSDEEIVFADLDGLHFADVVAGTSRDVPDSSGVHSPGVLGPGEVVALSFQGASPEVVLVRDAGLESLGEIPVESFDVQLFAATGDRRVLVVDEGAGRARLFSIPGRFELREVPLLPGANELRATASDDAGNASDPSDPIAVTFDDSGLPDLVLDGDIVVVPLVPSSGDVVSLAVTVRNLGASDAPGSLVQWALADGASGVLDVGSAVVPPLPAGCSAVVTRTWDTAALAGTFELSADADPLGVLDEKDETNNRVSKPVTVVLDRGVGLSVATGLPSYSSRQDVEIRVEAVNGDAASDVTLETVVEDALGARVAVVDLRTAHLGFGESTGYTLFWNTGKTLAGAYRVRVSAGAAAATTSFEIRRFLDVRATAGAARPSYVQGESAALLASVENRASNAPLEDLTLHFIVRDGSSSLVFESFSAIPYVALGGTAKASVVWPRIESNAGAHTLTVSVREGGREIASATASFHVTPATEVELEGRLALERPAVPVGGEIVARFDVENVGVLPFAGTVLVEVLDPVTGLVTISREILADVLPGEVFTGEARLDTTGHGLGRHSVVLSASAPLRSAPVAVTLFAVPAPPSLNAPAEGSPVPQPLKLSVNNATNPNSETLTYEFEIYLDDALTERLAAASGIAEGANATFWLSPFVLEENHRYVWRARARDRFATSEWMAPASLFADTVNEPPSAPGLSSPGDATEVDTATPALSVVNALDPEGASLTYTFEVYGDGGLVGLVFSVGGVPGGAGETQVAVAPSLDEDRTYTWRARAHDAALDSDWMAPASFRVNTANHPPSRPVVEAPVGVDVSTSEPELVARAGVDPEGEAALHRLEIDTSPSFDTASLQTVDDLVAAGDRVRWTPPLALTENGVYFWRARASDGASTSAWSETAPFRVDVTNEAPSVPSALSPLTGSVVESLTPPLAVVNATDPEGDALSYDFEIYEDEALALLAARIDSVREGEGRTAWAVSPRLREDRTYYWRARASDGGLASGWSPTESFLVNSVNARPSAPALSSPAEGSVVSTLPVTLAVVNAADPDGDALTYRFEVYEDPDLTVLVESSDEIPEASERTLWEVKEALVENHVYSWRARASDGSLEGAWMPTARFRFSLANDPPGAPVLVSPEDGAVVAEARPLLVVDNAVDPDGDDVLRYLFEIYSDPGLSALVVASGPVDEGDPRTSWRVTEDLVENETYYWRALASDGALTRASDDVFQLTVDALEEAPGPPTPRAPANGSTISTRTPLLVVGNATSPDRRPLRYHFELYDTGLVASRDDVPEGTGETSWEVPLELAPGATYSWRARAIDDRGLVSDWSDSFTFTVETGTTDCPPEWREDFDSYADGEVPSGWRERKEIGHAALHVEKGRLESRLFGRAAFLFEGSGESAGWRNYELSGTLTEFPVLPVGSDSGFLFCFFRSGFIFYSGPDGEYRLEVTGPQCTRPRARLVKIGSGGQGVLLAELELDRRRRLPGPFHVRLEVANEPDRTQIAAEIVSEGRTWWLQGEDADAPLRQGTAGAWANFVEAAWDDFHVRELAGRESGISGDENQDGVCDVEVPLPLGAFRLEPVREEP